MTPSVATRRQRMLELAETFLEEVRQDLQSAASKGLDLPPRLRSVHERVGHATPEYRTLAIPIPSGAEGASPEVLSGAIARYAEARPPSCLLLALDLMAQDDGGDPRPLLIAEARDQSGARFFFVQPYRATKDGVLWGEPLDGGWRDPGEEEMILDAAFRA